MFWSHITRAKGTTFFLMVLFFTLITGVGYAAGLLLTGEASPGILVLALVFASVSALIAYYNSDKMVLGMAGARALERAEDPYLFDMIEGLALAAQIPAPKPYLIDTPAMNAFATGRNPQHAAVAVTRGLREALSQEQLEGVIAHELSHILNYDMLVMTVATIFAAATGMLAQMLRWGRFTGGSRNRNGNGPLMLLALVLVILAPLLATVVKLAVSRQREFLADASAARLTRNPEGLASALIAIAGDRFPMEDANPALEPLMIANPFRHGGAFTSLLATHPPIEERVRRLRAM